MAVVLVGGLGCGGGGSDDDNLSPTTSTSTGTGTGTGASCLALQACCTSITNASIATACNAAKTGGIEQTCALTLQGFQQAGYCK